MDCFALCDLLGSVQDVQGVAAAIAQKGEISTERLERALTGEAKEGPLFWAVAVLVAPRIDRVLIKELDVSAAVSYALSESTPSFESEAITAILRILGAEKFPGFPKDWIETPLIAIRIARMIEQLGGATEACQGIEVLISSISSCSPKKHPDQFISSEDLKSGAIPSGIRAEFIQCMRSLLRLSSDPSSVLSRIPCIETRATLLDDSQPHTALFSSVQLFALSRSGIKNTRKIARNLLEKSINVSSCPWWDLYWAAQDALDEHSSHLLKDLLDDVARMLFSPDTLEEVASQAFESLFARCLEHTNELLVKYSLQSIPQFVFRGKFQVSQPFLLSCYLPSVWRCVTVMGANGMVNVVKDFLRYQIESTDRWKAVLDFALEEHRAHFPCMMAVLLALKKARKFHCDFYYLAQKVKSTLPIVARGYTPILRNVLIARILQIVDFGAHLEMKERPGEDLLAEKLRVFYSHASVVALGGPVGISQETLDDYQDLFHSGVFLRPLFEETVEDSALLLLTGAIEIFRQSGKPGNIFADLLHSIVDLEDRIYAPEREVRFKLHALVSFVACRAVPLGIDLGPSAKAITSIITRRIAIDTGDSLVQLAPIYSACLSIFPIEDSVVDALLMRMTQDDIAGAACLCILGDIGRVDAEQFSTLLNFRLPNATPPSSGDLGNCFVLSPAGSRAELIVRAQAAKWNLLARSDFQVPVEELIDAYAAAGVEELYSLSICLLKGIPSNALQPSANRGDELGLRCQRLCNASLAKLENRSREPLTQLAISGMVRVVARCLFWNEKAAISVIKKLLILGAGSPGFGSLTVEALIGELCEVESGNNDFQPTYSSALIDILADVVCYKECGTALEQQSSSGILEHSAIPRLAMLAFLECRAPLAIAVFSNILTRLNLPINRDCPMPLSDAHRTQLRSWQALALLTKHVKMDKVEVATKVMRALVSLLAVPSLPDVKEYQELIICFLGAASPDLIVPDLVKLLADVNAPVQVTASALVVAGFFIKDLIPNNTHIESLMKATIPYLTSNSAFIRCQAQHWLWSCDLDTTFPWLSGMVDFVKNQKDCIGLRKRLIPIYEKFSARCLGGVRSDKPERMDMLSSAGTVLSILNSFGNGVEFKDAEIFPCHPITHAIRKAVQDEMTETRQPGNEAPITEDPAETPNQSAASDHLNFQRKYVPTSDPLDQIQPSSRAPLCSSLIVIATFVDKMTNLAGLCRTSEVFGAQTLVVGNITVTKDPVFKNMAVTADQWMDIKEIKESDLKSYMRRLRSQGYSIVGLEQTASSKMLGSCGFPEKMALVLGSEKEGMPAWAVQELDFCVEIPQWGKVRSLNVHVSGALAIWEYRKGHRL